MYKAEDTPRDWEPSAGLWPGWSGQLGGRMAFLGRLEKGNPLQQLSSNPPSPALLPGEEDYNFSLVGLSVLGTQIRCLLTPAWPQP